jgi:diguanylate cyclase (GGDEF)-like protein
MAGGPICTIKEVVTGTVLIVDDDFTVRLLAREALEQAGFTVLENIDGAGVIRQLEAEEPDLVLLDVMLPVEDGITLCREIRSHPKGKHIPIVMMTGLDDLESVQNAYHAGATDFISKPFNWLVLVYRVRYMLRSSQLFDKLDQSQQRLNYAQLMAGMGSWEWDIVNDKLEWSDAVYRIFHMDPVGFDRTYHAFLNSVHPRDKEQGDAGTEPAPAPGTTYSIDHQIVLPSGEERYLHTEAEVSFDKSGRPCLLSGTVQDITDRKNDEERIRRLAYYDSLTGLPNRVLFKENLERALAHARRKNQQVATLFLDLDRFKWVNDTLGHSVGDQLLQEFATRLNLTLRKSDSVSRNCSAIPLPALARLGGDEFTIILEEIGKPNDAALVAARLLKQVQRPFVLEGQEIRVTASIGISIFPEDGTDIVTLIKNADTAMYHAKESGKNNFQFYTRAMTQNAFEQMRLENQLSAALDRQEFTLHYQPQVEIATGRITCLEALLRWNNPELGLVPPGSFIPLAEETGLIVDIDAWVLDQACRQLKLWADAGHDQLRVSVNLSGKNFLQRTIVKTTRAALQKSGVFPGNLELELTEGVLMHDADETAAILGELKALGLTLAIDHFGTGYSSLGYLKRFKVDTLKIDPSFIQDLTCDADSAAIVTALVSLADSLKMSLVAEGVETREQLWMLRDLGCRRIQGFLYSHPLPAHEVGALLSSAGGWLGAASGAKGEPA